jgi:hypothetical protein
MPASCPSCYTPGDRGAVGYPHPIINRQVIGPNGVPVITDPTPLYRGPMIEPVPPGPGGSGIPNPMPKGSTN